MCKYCKRFSKTLTDWGNALGGPEEKTLWFAVIRHEDWKRVSSSLRAAGADFHHVQNMAFGSLRGETSIIISTVRPRLCEPIQVSPAEAEKILVDALNALPDNVDGKILSSTKGWIPKEEENKEEKKFDPMGPWKHGEAKRHEIMDDHDLHAKHYQSNKGGFHSFGEIYQCPMKKFASVLMDLEAGECISGFVGTPLMFFSPGAGSDGAALMDDLSP